MASIVKRKNRYAQRFDEQFYKAKALSPEAEGKTISMPKFETAKDLPDPMAVTQEEMEKTAEPPQENSTRENCGRSRKQRRAFSEAVAEPRNGGAAENTCEEFIRVGLYG